MAFPSPFYTSTSANPIRCDFSVYNSGALTGSSQVLSQYVVPARMEIGQVVAYAGTAGTGGASTVLDILVSHLKSDGTYDTPTSIWATAGNRPTLAATATGAFSTARPDYTSGTSYSLALKPGDIISIQNPTISSTGHAKVSVTVALHVRG